jgi:hypothetical protein
MASTLQSYDLDRTSEATSCHSHTGGLGAPRPDETKTGDVTGINVISSPSLFTMRAPHGQLTAKLVCTFCVRGDKTDDGRGGLATTAFPRKRSQTAGT